jgi:TPP-dependent pyruvate/acetoin dehydrogenase alpha subunit
MNYQEYAINQTWSADAKIDLYRQMMRIRRFELSAMKFYQY